MDIDQRLKAVQQQNGKLFSETHTALIVLFICVIAMILFVTLPPAPATIITAISAFFILYRYVAYAIKKVNGRISLLENKYRNLSAGE